MATPLTRRELLVGGMGAGFGLGAGLGLWGRDPSPTLSEDVAAGTDPLPGPRGVGGNVTRRRVTTTPLFKSPPGFPNALQLDPDGRGIWVGEQKVSGQSAINYGVPEPDDLSESAWLMDWNGNVMQTVVTESRNTSGMAVGEGYVWMVANASPYGVFQTDMNSRTVSHRQIPLGAGGSHGAKFRDGKLWIASTRMRGALRVDPWTWEPEFLLPLTIWDRLHDIAFDDSGALWVVTGTQYTDHYEGDRAGLAKYDVESGRLREYAEFDVTECDPHGLVFHEGAFYSCDAGIHPGWPTNRSATAGYIFRIDLV